MTAPKPDAVITPCPECGAGNRIPMGRLKDGPVCGRCRKPMFSGVPVDLNDATFDAMVNGGLPVVVDFWAPWCGPCRTMAPEFDRAAGQLEPDVRMARVNTEEAQAVAGRHGIRSIPTMIVYRDGRELARHSGAISSSEIVRWVRSVV